MKLSHDLKKSTTTQPLTFEEILAFNFKRTLESNHITTGELHSGVIKYLEKTTTPERVAMEAVNLKKRLNADRMTSRTFMIGLAVLGVGSYMLGMTLHVKVPYGDKNTQLNQSGEFTLNTEVQK